MNDYSSETKKRGKTMCERIEEFLEKAQNHEKLCSEGENQANEQNNISDLLNLEYIYGYDGRSYENVFCLSESRVLFTISSFAVILNIKDNAQQIFRAHTNYISCINYDCRTGLVATAQNAEKKKNENAFLCIWNVKNYLNYNRINICAKYIFSIAISQDAKHIIICTGCTSKNTNTSFSLNSKNESSFHFLSSCSTSSQLENGFTDLLILDISNLKQTYIKFSFSLDNYVDKFVKLKFASNFLHFKKEEDGKKKEKIVLIHKFLVFSKTYARVFNYNSEKNELFEYRKIHQKNFYANINEEKFYSKQRKKFSFSLRRIISNRLQKKKANSCKNIVFYPTFAYNNMKNVNHCKNKRIFNRVFSSLLSPSYSSSFSSDSYSTPCISQSNFSSIYINSKSKSKKNFKVTLIKLQQNIKKSSAVWRNLVKDHEKILNENHEKIEKTKRKNFNIIQGFPINFLGDNTTKSATQSKTNFIYQHKLSLKKKSAITKNRSSILINETSKKNKNYNNNKTQKIKTKNITYKEAEIHKKNNIVEPLQNILCCEFLDINSVPLIKKPKKQKTKSLIFCLAVGTSKGKLVTYTHQNKKLYTKSYTLNHETGISCMRSLYDGLICASLDGEIYYINLHIKHTIYKIDLKEFGFIVKISCFDFLSQNSIIAGTMQNNLSLINFFPIHVSTLLSTSKTLISVLASHPLIEYEIALGSTNGELMFIDTERHAFIQRDVFTLPDKSSITSLCYSPNGNIIALGSSTGYIILLRTSNFDFSMKSSSCEVLWSQKLNFIVENDCSSCPGFSYLCVSSFSKFSKPQFPFIHNNKNKALSSQSLKSRKVNENYQPNKMQCVQLDALKNTEYTEKSKNSKTMQQRKEPFLANNEKQVTNNTIKCIAFSAENKLFAVANKYDIGIYSLETAEKKENSIEKSSYLDVRVQFIKTIKNDLGIICKIEILTLKQMNFMIIFTENQNQNKNGLHKTRTAQLLKLDSGKNIKKSTKLAFILRKYINSFSTELTFFVSIPLTANDYLDNENKYFLKNASICVAVRNDWSVTIAAADTKGHIRFYSIPDGTKIQSKFYGLNSLVCCTAGDTFIILSCKNRYLLQYRRSSISVKQSKKYDIICTNEKQFLNLKEKNKGCNITRKIENDEIENNINMLHKISNDNSKELKCKRMSTNKSICNESCKSINYKINNQKNVASNLTIKQNDNSTLLPTQLKPECFLIVNETSTCMEEELLKPSEKSKNDIPFIKCYNVQAETFMETTNENVSEICVANHLVNKKEHAQENDSPKIPFILTYLGLQKKSLNLARHDACKKKELSTSTIFSLTNHDDSKDSKLKNNELIRKNEITLNAETISHSLSAKNSLFMSFSHVSKPFPQNQIITPNLLKPNGCGNSCLKNNNKLSNISSSNLFSKNAKNKNSIRNFWKKQNEMSKFVEPKKSSLRVSTALMRKNCIVPYLNLSKLNNLKDQNPAINNNHNLQVEDKILNRAENKNFSKSQNLKKNFHDIPKAAVSTNRIAEKYPYSRKQQKVKLLCMSGACTSREASKKKHSNDYLFTTRRTDIPPTPTNITTAAIKPLNFMVSWSPQNTFDQTPLRVPPSVVMHNHYADASRFVKVPKSDICSASYSMTCRGYPAVPPYSIIGNSANSTTSVPRGMLQVSCNQQNARDQSLLSSRETNQAKIKKKFPMYYPGSTSSSASITPHRCIPSFSQSIPYKKLYNGIIKNLVTPRCNVILAQSNKNTSYNQDSSKFPIPGDKFSNNLLSSTINTNSTESSLIDSQSAALYEIRAKNPSKSTTINTHRESERTNYRTTMLSCNNTYTHRGTIYNTSLNSRCPSNKYAKIPQTRFSLNFSPCLSSFDDLTQTQVPNCYYQQKLGCIAPQFSMLNATKNPAFNGSAKINSHHFINNQARCNLLNYAGHTCTIVPHTHHHTIYKKHPFDPFLMPKIYDGIQNLASQPVAPFSNNANTSFTKK